MAKQLECKPCRLKKPFVEGALSYTMDCQEGDANTPIRMLTGGRLVVDPDMAAADLMKVLADFMVEHGTRDLAKLTACPISGMTGKPAPCIRWLPGLASLYSAFAVFAPIGFISDSKHKLALKSLHSLEAINLTKKSDADFFGMIDDRIRFGFKQYRVMKQCPLTGSILQEGFAARDGCHRTSACGIGLGWIYLWRYQWQQPGSVGFSGN